MRFLRIIAIPVTLLVNVAKGLWFLLCAIADMLWEDAFGKQECQRESVADRCDRERYEWMRSQRD